MKVKKIISILLCAALIFGVMSVGMTQAFATDDGDDRECPSNPGYTWDFSTGSADSTYGEPTNTLEFVRSQGLDSDPSNTKQDSVVISDGELCAHQTIYSMTHPVTLKSSNDWTAEIVAKSFTNSKDKTIQTVFSTDLLYGSALFIYINGSGDMFLAKKGSLLTDSGETITASSNYTYYKVSQEDFDNSILKSGFDVTQYHTYQMKCIGGVFSTWVDGHKIGNLSMSEQSTLSTRSSDPAKIYTGGTGTHFDFSNMVMTHVGNGATSNANFGLTATVKSLALYPGHNFDDGVVTTYPTDTEEGVRTYTCTLCGATKEESIPCVSKQEYYVWDYSEVTDFDNPNIANTSGSSLDNELSLVKTSISGVTSASQLISNETLNLTKQTTFKLSKTVTLNSENDWMVELVAKAKDKNTAIRSFLSQGVSISSATYFYIDTTGDLSLVKKGKYTDDNGVYQEGSDKKGVYIYYKVSDVSYNNSVLASGDFDTTEYHKYQLRCINGTPSFWLDGVKIGDYALSEAAATRSGNTDYTQGNGSPFGADLYKELKVDYSGCGSTSNQANQAFSGTEKSLAIYTDTCELNLPVGLDSATPIDPIYAYPGDTVELPTPETDDTCKEFLGWNTKNDGTGTMYAAGDNYVFSGLEQQALYGIWADAHDFGDPVWTWTGNDDDGYTAATATFTCSQCQTTETVDANVTTEESDGKVVYTATAEFQNETYTDTKTVYTDGVGARLAGHTISLDGDIAVNFYMELTDDIANSETAYMQFSIPDTSAEYQSQKVYVKDAEEKAGYYLFNCRVAAKNMKSQITAQIMDPENNKEGTPYTYSVNQYANYLLNNQADNPTFQAAAPLVQAMIAYGDYSENYFSANEALDEITTVDIPDGYALTSKNLPEGVSFTGATLSLKSQTSLSLYFKNENDEPITLSCDGREVKTEKINGEDVIRIRNIATAELNKPIKVKINNSDNYYVIYSPMAYCSKAQNSNSVKLRNSVKSLYNYWNEAYKYFVIPHSKQILLTNNLNWNNAYLYAWGNEGDLTGVFPGSLQYEIINSGYNNETQFKFYVPEDATGIVISNGEGAQTVDITDFNNYDGYWLPGGMDNAGHYNVNGFNL